jgi:hypothetical protein
VADGVKIHFQLEQDEDGYPPVAVESVWAQPAGKTGEYIIDNVPFFTRDATIGDKVHVREEDGNLWFERVVARSTNSLVRVVFFDRGAVEDVGRQLESLGCSVEYIAAHNLLAVSIPSNVPLESVQLYLQDEASADKIDYEEAILRQ